MNSAKACGVCIKVKVWIVCTGKNSKLSVFFSFSAFVFTFVVTVTFAVAFTRGRFAATALTLARSVVAASIVTSAFLFLLLRFVFTSFSFTTFAPAVTAASFALIAITVAVFFFVAMTSVMTMTAFLDARGAAASGLAIAFAILRFVFLLLRRFTKSRFDGFVTAVSDFISHCGRGHRHDRNRFYHLGRRLGRERFGSTLRQADRFGFLFGLLRLSVGIIATFQGVNTPAFFLVVIAEHAAHRFFARTFDR